MILETSPQARILVPMAISLGYGLLFATLIVLLLIPSLYLIVEDVRGLFGLKEKMPALWQKRANQRDKWAKRN